MAMMPPAEAERKMTVDLCERRKADDALTFDGLSAWEAAEKGQLDKLMPILLSPAFEGGIGALDSHGRAPIHYAAASGEFQMVKALLARGAEVQHVDGAGMTPIMHAAKAGKVVLIAELLKMLDKDVDVDQRDAAGLSVFHHAAAGNVGGSRALHCLYLLTSDRTTNVTPAEIYHHAAREGNYFSVCYCLEQLAVEPGDVSPLSHGQTALHEAAARNHADVAGLLAARCPELVDARNERGETPAKQRGVASDTAAAISARRAYPDGSNWDNVVNAKTFKSVLIPMVMPNVTIYGMSQVPGAAGFLGGFVVLAVVFILAQRVAKKMAPGRSDPGFAGWYFGALVYGTLVMVYAVFPHVDAPQLKLWWYANTVVMFGAYMGAILGNPGTIQSTQEDRQEVYKMLTPLGDLRGGGKLFYLDAMARRIPRSKYCSTTKKPVHRFDHYCGWTFNAIGGGNYRYFALFVLTQTLCHACVAYFTFLMYRDHPLYPKDENAWSPCTWFNYLMTPELLLTTYTTVFYNLACLVFVGAMLVTHILYISKNITSNEAWFPDRYDWVFKLDQPYTLYDQGLVYNWMHFLTGDLCGYSRAIPELNDYLRKKVTAWTEYRDKQEARLEAGRQQLPPGHPAKHGHSHGGKKCCNKSHGGGHNVPAVSGAAGEATAQASTVMEKVRSGECTTYTDPETGMMLPSMMAAQILALPYEQRKKMADRQKAQFASMGLLNESGQVSGIQNPEQLQNVQGFVRDFQQKLQSGEGPQLPTGAPGLVPHTHFHAPTEPVAQAAEAPRTPGTGLRSRSTNPKAE
eukprot:TRINITY_DN13574_c0_g1_i1.p1 TRINITY_DN13574_c0_g1~~TRINITY_DN13574_c0_g1_i1.p1  ORF type:complete len:800 (+),score=221.89 TRINITY_DN13574_c0_g1_i1:75-2474(+)